MFEKFLRKKMFKDYSKEDQEIILLCKDYIKMDYLSVFLVWLFFLVPAAVFFTAIITHDDTMDLVVWGIFSGMLAFALLWFEKQFREDITIFRNLVSSTLYFKRYVVKGKAILQEDFNEIKTHNEKLYGFIRYQKVHGYCYAICFEILKCLKKGTIQFVAVKSISGEEEDSKHPYTMHVLYVNNNWCFDTYSQTQHPIEEVMRRCKGQTYTSFSYKDIEGRTYEEFREENYLALKKWCEENNCSQEWMEEE